MSEPRIPTRVCVVGGGAAGLAAIRAIKDSPFLEGVLYERCSDVGGIWRYGDPVLNPMYQGLRTNLPVQVMGFLDFPFEDKGGPSFVAHGKVLEFLHEYTEAFNIRELIHFNTQVVKIRPVEKEMMEAGVNRLDNVRWEVSCIKVGDSDSAINVQMFDAVLICNGHFSKPTIPTDLGLSGFEGQVIHSMEYKLPGDFSGKRVVLLGCGPSAVDIALELVQVCSKVTISMRKPPSLGLPFQISQKPDIAQATGSVVRFTDGSEEMDVDVILLCTGYDYSLEHFLHPQSGLIVREGKYVTPLYQGLVNIAHPSMAVVGLQFRIAPFTLFDTQVRYYVKVLEGTARLPSKDEMLQDLKAEEMDRESRGIPLRHSHQLDELQWPYMEWLGKEGHFSHLLTSLPLVRKIFEKVAQRRRESPSVYKNDQITVTEDGTNFEIDEATS